MSKEERTLNTVEKICLGSPVLAIIVAILVDISTGDAKGGTFGDLYGGLIGAAAGFAGLGLMWSALRRQQSEFSLQRDDIGLQRKALFMQIEEFQNQLKEQKEHRKEFEQQTKALNRSSKAMEDQVKAQKANNKALERQNYVHEIQIVAEVVNRIQEAANKAARLLPALFNYLEREEYKAANEDWPLLMEAMERDGAGKDFLETFLTVREAIERAIAVKEGPKLRKTREDLVANANHAQMDLNSLIESPALRGSLENMVRKHLKLENDAL